MTEQDQRRDPEAFLREAVHDDLLPGERARLHRAYAETLEENCTGTDKRLAKLKARHAGAPGILRVLGEYEDDIEPDR